MKKPKISGVISESYPSGRIDQFRIEMQENLQSPIMSLFEELGFEEEKVKDLDIDYPSTKGYFFVYNKKIKAHIFVEETKINLIFDSNMDKENLVAIVEKYFSIFGE